MRSATHKPNNDNESSGPAFIKSLGNRSKNGGPKNVTDSSGNKPKINNNPPKSAQNTPKIAIDVPDSKVSAELSHEWEIQKITSQYGTVEAKIKFAAEKEVKDLEVFKEKELEGNNKETTAQLFKTGFKTVATKEGLEHTLEASLLSVDFGGLTLYDGVEVKVNASALNYELKRMEEDVEEQFNYFKLEGEVAGKIEKVDQIKGTWMDIPAIRILLLRGYSVSVTGTISYTINEVEELNAIKNVIRARRLMNPALRVLESAWGELKHFNKERLAELRKYSTQLLDKNLTRQQRKDLKKAIKAVKKKYRKLIKTATKAVAAAKKELAPLLKQVVKAGKKMKTLAGKVVTKLGLKLAARLLLKVIPIINIISFVLDIITIIRFYDVASIGGDGESPNFWDEVPDKRSEGDGPSGDPKDSGGSAPGLKSKDGKETAGTTAAKEKNLEEQSGVSHTGNKDEGQGDGGKNELGYGEMLEGTEENGAGGEIAKQLESEAGAGTNKENLTGDGEKETEKTEGAGASEEAEKKSSASEAGKGEDEELELKQVNGSLGVGKPKEEKKEASHFKSPIGNHTEEILPHEVSKDLFTKRIFPDKFDIGITYVTVVGSITSTGDTFTIPKVEVIVISIDEKNGTVTFRYPLGTQTFTINSSGREILFIGFKEERIITTKYKN